MIFNMADALCGGSCRSFDLTMIVPFKEKGDWYFQLRYHVIKENGEEGEVVIPKVRSPFSSNFPTTERELSCAWPKCVEIETLRTCDGVIIESTQYEGRENLYYYVKTKDAPVREMSHEEIEEILGHPFKEVKKKSTKKKED